MGDVFPVAPPTPSKHASLPTLYLLKHSSDAHMWTQALQHRKQTSDHNLKKEWLYTLSRKTYFQLLLSEKRDKEL